MFEMAFWASKLISLLDVPIESSPVHKDQNQQKHLTTAGIGGLDRHSSSGHTQFRCIGDCHMQWTQTDMLGKSEFITGHHDDYGNQEIFNSYNSGFHLLKMKNVIIT